MFCNVLSYYAALGFFSGKDSSNIRWYDIMELKSPKWKSLEFKYLQPKHKDNVFYILEIKANRLFDKEKSVEYSLFITWF